MVSLLDIVPATAKVPSDGGEEIEVHGVGVRGIALIFERFPAIQSLVGMGGADVADMQVSDIVAVIPGAAAAIIAAGCEHPGDKEYEAAADRLPAHLQVELLGAISRLTMPQGLGPFVEKLATILGVAGDGSPASKDPDSN